MRKIAVGIPFFASEHIEPLALCLKSLQKYTTLEYDLFILLNCSDPSQYRGFCFPEILKIADEVHVKCYCGDDNAYKQTVIDWITDFGGGYEYMFILHSDVFLYRPGVMEHMLEALDGTDHLISYWDVPTQLFQSTFHASEDRKMEFVVGPRVSTWFMCICVEKYREFRNRCPLGHCLFLGFARNTGDQLMQCIWDWFYENCPEDWRGYMSQEKAIIDHGGIVRYYLAVGEVSGAVLGTDKNPSFDSMNLYYNPNGYVHIEQTDPNRYNDTLYTRELLRVRMKEIRELLKAEYMISLSEAVSE